MLTLAKVATGRIAASYYEKATDYYSKEQEPSQWLGNGAQRLGLHSEVDASTFRNLLDGKMPDGTQIHNAAEGRRGGTDFTFSAPKSISLQALVGGDQRLIDSHETAVARTLAYAETLAGYRVTEQGETQRELSGNLLAATFRHDLSRANDPNLHTHCVVINATQRSDGHWRALEHSDFYRQQKLMGALYRSELALEVQKLGYEIRLTNNDGRFELGHINAEQISAFSTRSQAIEAALLTKGKTREQASAREREIANLSTRAKKSEVNRLDLHVDWQKKSQALGVNYRPSLNLDMISDDLNTDHQSAALDALIYSLAHNIERHSIIAKSKLIQSALEHGMGRTNLNAIKKELSRQVLTGELITYGDRFTTEAAQLRERAMLDVALRGRGAIKPIMNLSQAKQHLVSTSLNGGQRGAAVLMVSTSDRVIAIQGAAGTGKTTMLRQAKELIEAHGYQVLGLAPPASAARELAETGIQSQTLAAFHTKSSSNLTNKTVLIVDEAGMVASKDMAHILHVSEAHNSRVVLVGDVQQLKAVEAGIPFSQLQQAGISRVEMGEIQRQSDVLLRNAVELAAKGKVERSLRVLNKHVKEIDNTQERHAQIARVYAALTPFERKQTLMLAGTNFARKAINDNVRNELGLAGHGMMVSTLTRNDLTQVQARTSLSYQIGDIVEAKKQYESLGMQRGEFARVVDVAPGKVTLERSDGMHVQWRPAVQSNMIAYIENIRELSVGDAVRITSNNHSQQIINGDRAIVMKIDSDKHSIDLQKANGDSFKLDSSKPLHVDYGYCSTVHSSQGQTTYRVLIEADTRSATSNESLYYVAISRARTEVIIFTDDRTMLPMAMGREDVKEAALDINNRNLETEIDL